jgi:aryl-alcohol dehydrogenase-like predicted oxidoreductase
LKYGKLGTTGLDISALALGCMTYGDPTRGTHEWTLPEEQSRPLIKQAVEAGITFFDTANSYSEGTSEEIVGRALAEYTNRDEIVVATKVFFPVRAGQNSGGLSRKAIMTGVDASLRRLGMDYIDLYQIHRWDPFTPIEETLEALDDVVRAGKVRYLGASSMYAWQFSKALYTQTLNGWSRFVSMQDHYNLINREEEREMYPLCADQGIGVIPWSPLARGKLTRDWDESTFRMETDQVTKRVYPMDANDRTVAAVVGEIAAERGIPRAQVALAWVSKNPVVSAPIVGASKPGHLDDAIASLEIELSDSEVLRLEEPYAPHPQIGF